MLSSHDNRTNLLEQALRLFAARGYDAVGVQEIVDAAGVTKPTLYHYFGSKRGLLDALLQEHLSGFQQAVGRAAAWQGDLTMNLRNLAQAYFDFAKQQPLFCQFLLSAQIAPQDSEPYQAVTERIEQMFAQVMRLFEQALPHMQGRQRSYAVTFIGILNTYITLALNDYLELSDALVYSAVHQYMHGIFS
jgi:AcrR family transcriptional regulator